MKNRKAIGIFGGLLAGAAAFLLLREKANAQPETPTETPETPPETPPATGPATLFGQVTDNVNGQPIGGVSFTFVSGIGSTITDANGNYVTTINPGSHQIILSKTGYQTWSGSVTVVSGNNELDVQLIQSAPPETPVPFVYSSVSLELRPWSEIVPDAGAASCYPVFKSTITNPAAFKQTLAVKIYYQIYSTSKQKYYDPVLLGSFNLALDSWQSYQFVLDPRIGATRQEGGYYYNPTYLEIFSHGSFIWYMFLADSAGGESEHPYRT